jgi:DNA-3-methyladenine glycosylase II
MSAPLFAHAVIVAAERHLSGVSPELAGLIARHGECTLSKRQRDPFRALITSIISQQLSSKVAHAIRTRLEEKVVDITPQSILPLRITSLRRIGLSAAKTEYIKNIAKLVRHGSLNLEELALHDDDAVIGNLIKIKGIGRWTAEMFLIFGLGRTDVFSPGDAGIQRAMRNLYGEQIDMKERSLPWAPYRSIASWHLWRSLDS